MEEVAPSGMLPIWIQEFQDEDGHYYIASSDELMFTTEAEDFEKLLQNILECVRLGLEDNKPVQERYFSPENAPRGIVLRSKQ